jgi:xylulokinase
VLAGSPSAGAMVEWWLAHEAAGTSAAELFDAVAALDDGPSDVLVLPYLHGRQAPAPDPRARVQVIGSRGGLGAAPLAKALLEGLCLQARWILTEQATLAGERPAAEPIALLGGPVAANPAWPRLKSIVTGRTHRLVAEPEACAAGAALLAAARTGLVDEPVPALPARTVAVPRPRPDYDRTFAAFVAAATKEIA